MLVTLGIFDFIKFFSVIKKHLLVIFKCYFILNIKLFFFFFTLEESSVNIL